MNELKLFTINAKSYILNIFALILALILHNFAMTLKSI